MEDQVVELIKILTSKWCDLGPLFAPQLKEGLTEVLPMITNVVSFTFI